MPTNDELDLARAKAIFASDFEYETPGLIELEWDRLSEIQKNLYCDNARAIRTADAAMGVVSVPVDQIAEAVARGWCSPKNATKEMDVDLAAAITFQIVGLLAASPLREKSDAEG